MEEIKKLVKIVTLFSTQKAPLFDFRNLNEANKEELLLKNTINNKYRNDFEAMMDIYGDSRSSNKYRMLKSRVRKKLYNHLFFISNNTRNSKKAEKLCLDMLYHAKAIMTTGEHQLSEPLFRKIIPIAIKYEFTDVTLECYQCLTLIYTQLPEYNNFYICLEKLEFFKKIKTCEDESSRLYYISKLELNKSVASKKKFLEKIPHIIVRLRELWEMSGSFNSFQYYYYLNNWHLKLTGNYVESIRSLEICENLLKQGKINTLRFDNRANKYAHISALLKAHQYSKGLELAKVYINAFNPYSRNWFAFMEYYFLLAVHSNNLQLANDLIFEVDNNPYFKRLTNRAMENWRLYKTYLYFVYPKATFAKKFQYQDFISTVPEHSKDKLGYNVSIHILQFLYHLKSGDFDQLYYKEGALRKYLNTYLKDANSQRSKFFFRLLIVSIRVEFNWQRCISKGRLWLEKLKQTPIPGDAFAEIEIIPYEKLWEIILELIKPKQ